MNRSGPGRQNILVQTIISVSIIISTYIYMRRSGPGGFHQLFRVCLNWHATFAGLGFRD